MRRLLVMATAAAALAGCGSTADADTSVRTTIVTYFSALHRSDARDACEMLTEPSQERLGDFGYDVLKTGHKSCPAAFRALFGSVAGPRLRALPRPAITKVTRDGDRATARVRGIDGPIRLEHTKEGWRIDSEPAVEPDKAGGKDPDAG